MAQAIYSKALYNSILEFMHISEKRVTKTFLPPVVYIKV